MYPSGAYGCGCSDGSSSSSSGSGVSGSAGCTGLNVPCITVSNGTVTSLTDRTLTIPTQEVCPSDLCQEGATSGQVIQWNGSVWAPATISSDETRELAFSMYDLVGASLNIPSANNGLPAPDPTDYAVLAMDFNPTNYRLSVWVVNLPGSPGQIGYSFEYSTDLVSWTPSGGILDLNGQTSTFVTVTGTLAIAGNPSVVYIRPTYVNDSGLDGSLSCLGMVWTFWTS